MESSTFSAFAPPTSPLPTSNSPLNITRQGDGTTNSRLFSNPQLIRPPNVSAQTNPPIVTHNHYCKIWMCTFGTMQHQGPKNSHSQPKPSAASSAPRVAHPLRFVQRVGFPNLNPMRF